MLIDIMKDPCTLPNSRKERIGSLSTQFQDIKSHDKLGDHCIIAGTLKVTFPL